MEFDPNLDVHTSAPPAPWGAEASAQPESETQFLDAMRPQLEAYLRAHDMDPLVDAEWEAYRDAAVQEFGAQREQLELRAAAGGDSTFNDVAAEATYLQDILKKVRCRVGVAMPLGAFSFFIIYLLNEGGKSALASVWHVATLLNAGMQDSRALHQIIAFGLHCTPALYCAESCLV